MWTEFLVILVLSVLTCLARSWVGLFVGLALFCVWMCEISFWVFSDLGWFGVLVFWRLVADSWICMGWDFANLVFRVD